jgi:hypothetical protein
MKKPTRSQQSARRQLAKLKPLADWEAEKPRTEDEIELAKDIVKALKKEARGDRR